MSSINGIDWILFVVAALAIAAWVSSSRALQRLQDEVGMLLLVRLPSRDEVYDQERDR